MLDIVSKNHTQIRKIGRGIAIHLSGSDLAGPARMAYLLVYQVFVTSPLKLYCGSCVYPPTHDLGGKRVWLVQLQSSSVPFATNR